MSSKHGRQRPSPVAVVRLRPGEGVSIDVSTSVIVGPNGQPGTAIAFDLSKAKVPDRRYAADVCSVARIRGAVKLVLPGARRRIGLAHVAGYRDERVGSKSVCCIAGTDAESEFG